MDQRLFIAQLNIEHYRWKLNGVLDAAQRRMIVQLLAEEEAKLAALRAALAEGSLAQLLNLLARRAVDLLNARTKTGVRKSTADLAAIFDRTPCAISLIDDLGKIILMNDATRRFVSSEIPSRDPQSQRYWRVFDGDGRAISPALWPGAKALRGEPVNPGLPAIHTAHDGRETAVRVAAVPVPGHGASVYGAVAAVYEMPALEREGANELLEKMLTEEQS